LIRIAVLLACMAGGTAAQDGFRTPGGGIHCIVERAEVRCDVLQRMGGAGPRPPGCLTQWGHAFAVARHGRARVLCAGDTLAGEWPVLPEGIVWQRLGVFCEWQPPVLRCINQDGHGFRLGGGPVLLF
jgi:hypothetical protein